MMTKRILERARALIADQANWCRWDMAEAAGGRHVDENSVIACRWCALGAVRRAAREIIGRGGAAERIEMAAAEEALACGMGAATHNANMHFVVGWNDEKGRTHEQVLSAFDRAIEAV